MYASINHAKPTNIHSQVIRRIRLYAILLLVFGLSHQKTYAQNTENYPLGEPCGFSTVLNQLEKQYPGFKSHFDLKTQALLAKTIRVEPRKKRITDTLYSYDTIYVIPLVFHVIYNVANENIHDSLLQSQVAVLNRDFNRLNADTVKTRSFFKSRSGSARIQFEFASIDPSGKATSGIIRKASSVLTFGSNRGNINDLMKESATGGNDPWDPEKYVNIWVCDLSVNNQDILFGYAYPPYGHPSWSSNSWVADPRQGVVLHYKIVGEKNPRATGAMASSNMGRVAVHELGHYFGLRHTWADDQNLMDKCSLDDYIDDTPLQGIGAAFACNLGSNTCIESSNDLPDMIENYMDYASHSCQNIFTKRQIQMMRNSISDYRTILPVRINIISRATIFDTVVYDKVMVYAVRDKKQLVVEVDDENVLGALQIQVFSILGQAISNPKTITNNETFISTMGFRPGMYVAVLSRLSDGKVIRKQSLFID